MTARYCEQCGEKREYIVDCRPDTVEIHGITVRYSEYFATCKVCGSPVYVPELNDANVQQIEDAYRQEAGLITVDEIRQLMDKYEIGASPLARILGFGEVTIARYLGGSMPSRKNSEILRSIAASANDMGRYLETGRARISDNAYNKCRSAVDQLLLYENCGKVEYVAQYLLQMLKDITPLALQKLLYFSQGFYAVLNNNTPLFADDCQAWAYGPVYPNVYHQYKRFGYFPIDIPVLPFVHPELHLSPREREVINAVADSFGHYSGDVLRDITHMESPWIQARGNLPETARSSNIIEKSDIIAYFSEVVQDYDIATPADIQRYSSAMAGRNASTIQ